MGVTMFAKINVILFGAVPAAVRALLGVALAAGFLTLPSARAETVAYSPHTTIVNGLRLTVFTKPTDDSGALRIARV